MKYSKSNLDLLIGLPVSEAKLKVSEWFDRTSVVYGYHDVYPLIARDRVMLFVDDKEKGNDDALVILAEANDTSRLQK